MSEAVLRSPPTGGQTLRPVVAAFLLFGLFWGAWTVSAADVESTLGLSHGGFGLLFSVALAAAAVTNAIGGAIAERHGTSRLLAAGLVAWGSASLLAAFVPGRMWFAMALVGVLAFGGLVDVAMNVAATAGLAGAPGRLVRFHGLFNLGAGVGAGAAGLLLARQLSWRWVWVTVGVAAVATAVWTARTPLPAGTAGERMPFTGALRLLRRERIVVLAVAFAVASMVEGGVELWGVLFLRTHMPSGLAVGATSAVIGYFVAATARAVFGPVAGRRGPAHGVAVGAGSAAIGSVLLATASPGWLAGAGLVLAAGGVSMCWPLLLAHASAGRTRPAAVVGGMTSVGYLGFVAGPAIVGGLAEGVGLRTGLFVLAAAAMFVALVPAVVRPRVGAGEASRPL